MRALQILALSSALLSAQVSFAGWIPGGRGLVEDTSAVLDLHSGEGLAWAANLSPGSVFKAPAKQIGVLSSGGGRIFPGISAPSGIYEGPLALLASQGILLACLGPKRVV